MKAKISEVTEQEFLNMLITDTRRQLSLAHLYGWQVAHFRAARTKYGWVTAVAGDGAGFPDLVLVRAEDNHGRVIWAEIKRQGEKPRLEQRRWLDLLYNAGEEVYLWYVSDIQEIAEILRVDQGLLPGRNKFKSSWGNRR